MTAYRLLTGFNYKVGGVEVRHEAGEIVTDFPADDAAEWVAAGCIELVEQEATPTRVKK